MIPGEQLVTRLWETVAEKGVGGLLKPWQIRRVGRAITEVRAERLVALGRVEAELEQMRNPTAKLSAGDSHDVLIGTDRPAITAGGSDRRPIEIAAQAVTTDALRREINVSKALIHAEAELADNPNPPPHERVDADWLFRWREAAGAVSNEILQSLWGKVIAGEIASPGSFSLRTLEFLRNISQDEAKAVERLSQLAIANFVYRDKALSDSLGLSFGFLVEMQDLGIISGVESLGFSQQIDSSASSQFVYHLIARNRCIVVTHGDRNKSLQIPSYPLTKLGLEVLRLGNYEANEKVIQQIAGHICAKGFRVHLADVTHSPEKSVTLINATVFCDSLPEEASIPATSEMPTQELTSNS